MRLARRPRQAAKSWHKEVVKHASTTSGPPSLLPRPRRAAASRARSLMQCRPRPSSSLLTILPFRDRADHVCSMEEKKEEWKEDRSATAGMFADTGNLKE